jgi:hypothetical protein
MRKYTHIILAVLVVILSIITLVFFVPHLKTVSQIPSAADLEAASVTIAELSTYVIRTRVAEWHIPASSRQGVPVFMSSFGTNLPSVSTMYIYDFNGSTSRLSDANVFQGGGSVAYGGTAPIPSPNFLHTAYIDSSSTLYIISNETLQKQPVYQEGKDSLSVVAWSPNSKKLIFSLRPPEDESGPLPHSQADDSYYVFDTSDGSLVAIPASKGVTLGQFLDDTHVIVYVTVGEHTITTAIDLDTLYMDQTLFNKKLGFTLGQDNIFSAPRYVFSIDRTKVTYNDSRMGSESYVNPPPGLKKGGESYIVLGDLKSGTKTVLAKGVWAQYQQTILSPDGTKVAYEEIPRPGPAPSRFWVYDASTGESRAYEYDASRVIEWLNDDKLLFISYSRTSSPSTHVLDTNTGSIKSVP